jgi:hypothetical protein
VGMSEHKWFGVPFDQLDPVQRANARYFLAGNSATHKAGE